MNARLALAVTVLLFGMAACFFPGVQANDRGLAATITAQALALQASNNAGVASATAESPTANSAAQVSVTSDTNCRTGPSSDFDLVLTMHPGATAPVIGKYPSANYWIISNPAGGSCWLWGQYATVTGDTSSVPDYPAPAAPSPKPTKVKKPTETPEPSHTPAPVAPNVPANLAYDRTCEGAFASDGITPIWVETVNLTWQDSSNETGYRPYKDGSVLPTLPPNSTAYHMTLRYNQGTGGALWVNFAVEAFNDAGSSPKTAVDVPKCP
jgi:uncharacterized protein YraI